MKLKIKQRREEKRREEKRREEKRREEKRREENRKSSIKSEKLMRSWNMKNLCFIVHFLPYILTTRTFSPILQH